MPDAFIYDHVRTPRGRGRPDGSLHEISSVQLAAQMLEALAERSELDTGLVDDVILGCAQPVGEQGGNIARAAVCVAGYAESVAGQQVHRFCASALEAVNNGAAQIMTGAADAAIGGGVESMSRTVIGADSGAWSADPWVAYHSYFAPQGIGADLIATLDGFTALGEAGFDAVALQKYPQIEGIEHIHTAGNSSGIVDGAAGVLLGNEAF